MNKGGNDVQQQATILKDVVINPSQLYGLNDVEAAPLIYLPDMARTIAESLATGLSSHNRKMLGGFLADWDEAARLIVTTQDIQDFLNAVVVLCRWVTRHLEEPYFRDDAKALTRTGERLRDEVIPFAETVFCVAAPISVESRLYENNLTAAIRLVRSAYQQVA